MMVWVYEDMEVWYGVLQYDIMMVYIYIYIYREVSLSVFMEVWNVVLQCGGMIVWVGVFMEVWNG